MTRRLAATSRLTTALLLVLALLSTFAGCGHMASPHEKPALPTSANPWVDTDATLVWVGRGRSYRYTPTGWVRTPNADYDFTVVQRRYQSQWQSVKTLHRRHPDYDGSAGPRDQTYYFGLAFAEPRNDNAPFSVDSTLGRGTGSTDIEYRNAQLEIVLSSVSRFAPFNVFRLSQKYLYESGNLQEVVELLKRNDVGNETPFAKIEEQARLFAPGSFASAPVVRAQ